MTSPTEHLRTLARTAVDTYAARCRPRAALVVGSAATGDADRYSDVDLLLYYDAVPEESVLAQVREDLGAERFHGRRSPDDGSYGERYYVHGVQHQVAHVAVRVAESEIAKLVGAVEVGEELAKIVMGLFEGLPLRGAELIEAWRRDAAYTEVLQRAMIERHWRFFPWWYFQEKLRARDATVWRHDVLVQSAYSIVGVLAALNRVYFSTVEFKRARKFLGLLDVSPPDLADRLELLFAGDERASTDELERLVAETQALVAERFPDLDLAIEWGGRPTPPGGRESPWT